MVLFVLLVTVLAITALVRANAAQQRAADAEREVGLLRNELLALRAELVGERPAPGPGSVPLVPLPDFPTPDALAEAEDVPVSAPPPVSAPLPEPLPAAPALTVWPEDIQQPSPPKSGKRPNSRPAGPSLWGPEFSRARISVFGGALVLGGLAFTLRALGLPAWTLLLAVFAFGGVLYGTARLVPWPVSGALRGLGYGVTALGLGSLAQKLPGAWGPGVVLLGLLALSAALTWDGLRRREPLLGVMAAAGASLSVWMLADDIGRWSILALAAVLLLVTAAVGGLLPHLRAVNTGEVEHSAGEMPQDENRPDLLPDAPETWRAALTSVLGVAGALPVGWLVAALNHEPLGRWASGDWDSASLPLLDREVLGRALHVSPHPMPALLLWLVFAGLALLLPLTLLRSRGVVAPGASGSADIRDAGVRLGAAWATLTPSALFALAVGTALSGPGARTAATLGTAALALLGLSAAAWWAWQRARPQNETQDAEATLAGTLSSSLTAGATGVAASLLITLLGARTEPLGLAALAGTLLLVGLYGHSRLSVWLGAAGLSLTALWGLDLPPAPGEEGFWTPLLRVSPALVGLAGALRAAQWRARHPHTPPLAWLAGLCGAVLVLGLGTVDSTLLLLLTLALSGVAWLAHRSSALAPDLRGTLYWGALPGLLLGGFLMARAVGGGAHASRLLLVGSLAAALTALLTARQAQGGREKLGQAKLGQRTAEAGGLVLLALALAFLARPAQFTPALALTALVAALLPLRVRGERVRWLLLLGLPALAWQWLASSALWQEEAKAQPLALLGAWLLLLVSWLTQDDTGRRWLSARVPARSARVLRRLPRLASAQQTLWFAVFLDVAVTAGVFLSSQAIGGWLLTGSGAVMAVGISACARAARPGGDADARDRWTMGLSLVIAAGLKGAGLDAATFSQPAVVLGLVALVTGLSLLLLAVLAPRPRLEAPAPVPARVEREEREDEWS